MVKPISPHSIPPPLPPKSQATSAEALDCDLETSPSDRNVIYLIAATIAGLFLLIMLLIALMLSSGGADAGNDDKRGSIGGTNEVDGSLDDKNSLPNDAYKGDDQKQNSHRKGSQTAQQSTPASKPLSDTTSSNVNDADIDSAKESKANSANTKKSEEMTVFLSHVPNRQNQSVVTSGDNSLGDGARDRGINLASGDEINPFVGEGKAAESTVFVIDVSGSMQTADKLPRVKSALIRAIEQLKDNQRFAVFLFDDNHYSEPTLRGLVAATESNQDRVKKWLEFPPGGGGTQPMVAMVVAIALKPERIVLLSDGEFDPSNIQTITMLNSRNRNPARIDCVGLMEDVQVLREIAKNNRGIYYQAW
jgi:Mg-chelatase subunit ChlD